MSHRRRFWEELLMALEESLAAFSGVDPDLIDAPKTTPKTCRDGGRVGSSVQRPASSTGRRDSETRSRTVNRGSTEGW